MKYRVNFAATVILSGSVVVEAESAEDATAFARFGSLVDDDLQGSWFRSFESCDSTEVRSVITLDADDDMPPALTVT
jgi:hypothetical protein